MPHDKALKRGFTLLEMFYWMTCGSFNTYMVSYLTAVRGVSASGAGLMLALVMASACAGQLLFALALVAGRVLRRAGLCPAGALAGAGHLADPQLPE